MFKSEEILLEGMLHVPSGVDHTPYAVVVCHPHPLYGGSMHNAVVKELCRALEEEGVIALRFNFRGVGASEGVYQEGVGERLDVIAALDFLSSMNTHHPEALGVAGYSFGAYVLAHAASQDPRVEALALISPPFTMYSFEPLEFCRKPKLIVWGRRDELVGFTVTEVAKMVADPKSLVLVEEADHFWTGMEWKVSSLVASFFKKVLKGRVRSRNEPGSPP